MKNLLKHKLLHHDSSKYDGFRLTYLGYDFLAIKMLVNRGIFTSVGREIGVRKELVCEQFPETAAACARYLSSNNRNHPNFSWSNNQNIVQQSYQQVGNKQLNPPEFQQPRQFAQKKPYPQQGGVAPPSSADFEELKLLCKSQAVSIKTLENQIGQIANALLNRQPGTLSSDTKVPGSKEAVTLRSGKVVDAEKAKDVEDEVVDEE
ncbi:hypothetical protein AgCh_039157 [Apium graveolens]